MIQLSTLLARNGIWLPFTPFSFNKHCQGLKQAIPLLYLYRCSLPFISNPQVSSLAKMFVLLTRVKATLYSTSQYYLKS